LDPLPRFVQLLALKTGVIGALSLVNPLPLADGRMGDVGLICSATRSGRTLSTADIVTFFEQTLSPMINPFPGPRSVVILDNAPGHRAIAQQAQVRIRTAVQRRGGILIWNPPHSPDLNPIEHLWQVTNKLASDMIHKLQLGLLGPPRPFAPADLQTCLRNARLSRLAYRAIFQQPI